jgi:DNA topoisomerase-1
VSDLKKYEKARTLKQYIDVIRSDYRKGWTSKDSRVKQMSMAVYLIDKLALRAGGEKDDDLADTVGCCTLRVGHIFYEPPSSIKFDFLGKDSIRYEQTHEIDPLIYAEFQKLTAGTTATCNLEKCPVIIMIPVPRCNNPMCGSAV